MEQAWLRMEKIEADLQTKKLKNLGYTFQTVQP